MDNLTNQELAQEISARIGNSPVPFDSVYSIALQIYNELGGEASQFDSVYSILLEILPLAGGVAHIDDSSISTDSTWSSSKISSELADAGFKTEFVNELPATGDIHTIYFVPSGSALTGNVYDEFMWNANASEWEQVGSTAIDLTDIINDASVLSNRTWSSEKINSELEALAGDANSEIVAAETIDVTFVNVVPSEAGTEGQYVIYTTEAEDTLYKYENSAWEVQTIDANKLYFDTENNVLYSYKSATHKFAEVGVDNTIIFSGSITSNAAKAALNPIKTPGVYNVLQHQTSGSKTTMTNWVMTVTFLDSNEADEVDGSVYQKLENNYTVYKRYYKPTTNTWTSMTKYYEGLVRDALTSSAYYSWSVNKIKSELATKQDVLTAGAGIDISNGIISATGGDAIEEVSELPEASENKNKLFRLDNSDKDVYAAKLLSSETITTNRLPDAQQIDKAYLYDTEDNSINYYKGVYHIICNDGETDGYMWYQEGYVIVTLKNAETITNSDKFSGYLEVGVNVTINDETKIITIDDGITILTSYQLGEEIDVIPAIYNAPESAQIGNAYIIDGNNKTYTYNGSLEIRCSNGSKTFYYWNDGSYEVNNTLLIKIPASEIVSDLDNNGAYCIAGIVYGDDSTFNAIYSSGIFTYWEYNGTLTELENELDFTSYTIGFMISNDGGSLYIPQLNAPDSEQVDNAYIETDYLGSDASFEYKGSCILHLTDGDVTAYKWTSDNQYAVNVVFVSTVPASDIYSLNTKIWAVLTTDDSEWSGNESTLRDSTEYTGNYISQSYFEDRLFVGNEMISNYSTVKYQRTEVTEVWDWKNITPTYASDSDIDAMFESSSPVVKRVLMKLGSYINEEDDEENPSPSSERYPLSILEGLVNENDETMEYDGDTYYKWIKYENRGNGTSTPDEVGDENVIVLTTSLNPTLPFNSSSPEWAYMIGSESEEAVYASPSTETYPKEALIHQDGSITYEE